ncbi:MAG: hypothetical protein IPJ67_04160 [Candidatus Moraniibacteriota bacterium]|nr:MAG: hypothetical protein IPJ67_04160 [Candidatus Moranbacteria bacterium]
MTLSLTTLVADMATLLFLFVALVFTAGIVWRVEKELDVSYKLFLGALVVLLLSESLGKFFSETMFFVTVASLLKTLFAMLLLAGIWTMRDLIRRLDGEKDNDIHRSA